jgi:hypothetical protein
MQKCKLCKKEYEYGKYTPREESLTGICHDCLNKSFPISQVCRIDLLSEDVGIKPSQLKMYDDSDMKRIAEKMADAYSDSDYWIALEIIAKVIKRN